MQNQTIHEQGYPRLNTILIFGVLLVMIVIMVLTIKHIDKIAQTEFGACKELMEEKIDEGMICVYECFQTTQFQKNINKVRNISTLI